MNDRPGAFAEYVVIDYDLTWHIHNRIGFEEAAGVSLCGVTAAQGVFQRLKLPSPFTTTESFGQLNINDDEPINVFIYGASSSVGFYAAQLIRKSEKISGKIIRLIGAASPSKHALLYNSPCSYDVLLDYRNPQWPDAVWKASGGEGVHYAIDAISQGSTVEQTGSIIRPGGKFAIFRAPAAGGFDITKLKIKPVFGAVWEALGVEVIYHGGKYYSACQNSVFLVADAVNSIGITIPANAEARAFAAAFYEYLGSGARTGQIKLHPIPVRVMPGGLEKIPTDGFALLSGSFEAKGQGKKDYENRLRPISGEKIVYVLV